MVGGRDYVGSNYNRATQANRQPGSSFKLFVYLAALEAGYRPDTIVQDEPITINGWTPRNDNGRHAGPIPLRIAFAYSVNTVAVRLAQQVGTRAVADMAQRFGITTPDRHQSEHGAGLVRGAPDRHDPGLCLGRARRRLGDALRHPPGDDDRQHHPLPASGRRGPDPGRALGRRADDRIAPGRGPASAPAAPPSSAGRPRARPGRRRRTRTAGSSAFRAGSPPACGWAATTIALCPASPAAARRPAPSTISWPARSPTGRSSNSPPTSPARNGRSTRATTSSSSPRPTTRLWSTRTAIRSSRRRRRRTTGRGAARRGDPARGGRAPARRRGRSRDRATAGRDDRREDRRRAARHPTRPPRRTAPAQRGPMRWRAAPSRLSQARAGWDRRRAAPPGKRGIRGRG